MSIYTPLSDLLKRQVANTIILTFKEIEKIIGKPLPDSSGNRKVGWWADSTNHRSQSHSWLNAGFTVKSVDYANNRAKSIVTFERILKSVKQISSPASPV